MSLLKEKKFEIYQDGDAIMFIVHDPDLDLDEYMIAAFDQEVRERNLKGVILPNIREIIRGAKPGEAVKIGGIDRSKAAKLDFDPAILPFKFSVSRDSLEAYIEVSDSFRPLEAAQVGEGLKKYNISYGLIRESIELFIREWPNVPRILIAKGMPPEDGIDGSVEQVKHVKANLTPEINEDGQVDFKHLNLISPVEEGDVLQIRRPPCPGEDGMDVHGHRIQAIHGKDVPLIPGDNTEIREDGTRLVATKPGFLHIGRQGEVHVRSLFTVEKDVDYSTGNIEYKGDILVKGDVRAGFSVKSGGDVIVRGAVEDAVIEAAGDVVVKGGVVSSGSALIKAGRDVSIGFVQHARIEAGGSVFIKIAAMSAKIFARRDVEVLRHEGRIYGGEIEVGGWVVAQIIGCETCSPLRIKFHGMEGAWDNPDDRYKFSFVSANSIESPVKVVFGPRMLDIRPRKAPINVTIDEKRIVTQSVFIGPGKLEKLRREREQMEKSRRK